jgi:long-subunit fatty acid transport protein
MMKIYKKLILLLLVSGLHGFVIAGDATLKSTSNSRTLSLGGLYYAGNDGLSSILNNAAGVFYSKSRTIELSIIDAIGQSELDNPINGLYRSFQEDDLILGAGLFWPIADNLIFSIGYQRVYNYRVSWPFAVFSSNDSSSVLQAFDMKNSIVVDAILPSFAINFGIFSIGASFSAYNVNYNSAFPLSNNKWSEGIGLPAYQMEYKMDAWTFGFNAGIMVEIGNSLRGGAFVRSSFSADLKGDANSELFSSVDSLSSTSSISTTYQYPWIIGAGFLYKVSDHLAINLDCQYSLFENATESLDIKFGNQEWELQDYAVDSLTGINPADILLAFQNTIDVGLGAELIFENWSFRGGYRFDQSTNSLRSYNFLYPTVDRHWIAFGFGYNDSAFFVDVTAAYAVGVRTNIISYPSVSGIYDSETIKIALTMRYNF